MWDCGHCGCRSIAPGVPFCPQCFKPKEESVPKVTSGGASNAKAVPGEPGYIAPAAEVPEVPEVPAAGSEIPEAPAEAPPEVPAPVPAAAPKRVKDPAPPAYGPPETA